MNQPTPTNLTMVVSVRYKFAERQVRVTATREQMADVAKTQASREFDWPYSEIYIIGGRVESTPPHLLARSDRDWPEDFGNENGNYVNTCMGCRNSFFGHKRRIVCKKCDADLKRPLAEAEAKP